MSDDNNETASNIITYIGVPLAVLGVLPILYNVVKTFVESTRIKRRCKLNNNNNNNRNGTPRFEAKVRGEYFNGKIEVQLPRFALSPPSRDLKHYWTVSGAGDLLPGGSWRVLHWNRIQIGKNYQRVEHVRELVEPQAEVNFEALVLYLLDLGATPFGPGWKALRAGGLWTEEQTTLLTFGDKLEHILTVTRADDSEGRISLALRWHQSWATCGPSSLEPSWINLSNMETNAQKSDEKSHTNEKLLDDPKAAKGDDNSGDPPGDKSVTDIACHITGNGIKNAIVNNDQSYPLISYPHILPIQHLNLNSQGSRCGVWFASAISAFAGSQGVLVGYRIPDHILDFANANSVPCGILEILGFVEDSEVPEWVRTRTDVSAELASKQERRVQPAQTYAGDRSTQGQLSGHRQRIQDAQDSARLKDRLGEMHIHEALQSTTWDSNRVADHMLRWLKGHNGHDLSLYDSVGAFLYRMITDVQFAGALCQILDLWKSWVDNGGMRRTDFVALQDRKEIFAYATLLVAQIEETVSGCRGSMSWMIDLQECLSTWKVVRLG